METGSQDVEVKEEDRGEAKAFASPIANCRDERKVGDIHRRHHLGHYK